MPSSFVGELFGTMMLVLLGNGVVANVVLNQTKGNSSGWIVITTGWAFAVMSGVFTAAALVWGIGLSLGGPTGYAINPARDLGPRIAHAILPIAGKGDSDWSY
ncbi:MAG: aquaporin, partial [Chloroflexia bacterium]|nr:aquaporin [Chloroflexia bacterium]